MVAAPGFVMKGRTTPLAHVHIPGPGDPWLLLLQRSTPGSVPELKGRKLQLSPENKEGKPIFVQMLLEFRGREGAAPSARSPDGTRFSILLSEHPPVSLFQVALFSSIPSTLLLHFVPICVPAGVQDSSSYKECCFPHALYSQG